MLNQLEIEFSQVRHRWKIHSELFSNAEKVELLNRCGGSVFGLLQKLITYDTLSALCRINDPAKSVGKENNSLRYHFEKLKSNLNSKEVAELEDLFSNLEDKMKNIKAMRNKALSHDAIEIAEKSAVVQQISYKEIEESMDIICTILNKLFKSTGNYIPASKFGPGPSKLFETLKKGLKKHGEE